MRLGPLTVSPHGLGIALGYFVGAWLMARRARRAGFDEDHTWNAAAWGVIGAILGARVAYVVGHLDAFGSPLGWLKIWEGGISLIGGLLGGMLAVALYLRRHELSFLELGDLGAPGLALGIALGRSGDLIIGDHLGKPTSGWWGWVYKGGELISPPPCITPEGQPVYPSLDGCIQPGMVVHQSALYDAIWSLIIFAILLRLARRARRAGFLFLTWASLYALGRIVTDFLRVDKTWLFGLTGSQITSLLALAFCGYLLLRYRG
ncbi:MAG: prolipoprotein diacylglyceryl transferase, partial [Actinomycetota bacterium]